MASPPGAHPQPRRGTDRATSMACSSSTPSDGFWRHPRGAAGAADVAVRGDVRFRPGEHWYAVRRVGSPTARCSPPPTRRCRVSATSCFGRAASAGTDRARRTLDGRGDAYAVASAPATSPAPSSPAANRSNVDRSADYDARTCMLDHHGRNGSVIASTFGRRRTPFWRPPSLHRSSWLGSASWSTMRRRPTTPRPPEAPHRSA